MVLQLTVQKYQKKFKSGIFFYFCLFFYSNIFDDQKRKKNKHSLVGTTKNIAAVCGVLNLKKKSPATALTVHL